MRNFLSFVRMAVIFMGVFAVALLYTSTTAALATVVINDCLFGSFVSLKTGFAAVLFVMLTIWPPIVLFCGTGRLTKMLKGLDDGGEAW